MNTSARTVRWMTVAAVSVAAVTAALSLAAPAASSAPRGSADAPTTAPCTASDLGVWVAADQRAAAMGTMYAPLEFTNLSRRACTMHGFPRISAISGSRQLGSPATRDHAVPASTVRLAPGATAYALLEYSEGATSNCPSGSRILGFELRVYPPGQRQADHALWGFPACMAKGSPVFLRVRVIVPGIGVRGDSG